MRFAGIDLSLDLVPLPFFFLCRGSGPFGDQHSDCGAHVEYRRLNPGCRCVRVELRARDQEWSRTANTPSLAATAPRIGARLRHVHVHEERTVRSAVAGRELQSTQRPR